MLLHFFQFRVTVPQMSSCICRALFFLQQTLSQSSLTEFRASRPKPKGYSRKEKLPQNKYMERSPSAWVD